MSKKEYHEFKCTIHNADVKIEKLDDPKYMAPRCPYCAYDALVDAVESGAKVLRHRDVLLSAIEIKLTVPADRSGQQ